MTEEQVRNLSEENARLHLENAKAFEERDAFKRAYLDLIERSDPGFTKEDFENGIPTGPWFDEFLRRIEDGDPNAADCVPQHRTGI